MYNQYRTMKNNLYYLIYIKKFSFNYYRINIIIKNKHKNVGIWLTSVGPLDQLIESMCNNN